MKISDKEKQELIYRIRQESQNLQNVMDALEVRHSSLKREHFCKKHKMNFSQYIRAVKMGRSEMILYPLYMNCVDLVFSKNKKAQKDYRDLLNSVMKVLQVLIDKEKKKEEKIKWKNIIKTDKANEMKGFLEGLAKDREEKKAHGKKNLEEEEET